MNGAYPAQFWHLIDQQAVGCDLCPRECHLQPGQFGFCQIRQNINAELYTYAYGRASGFAVDPIEKKPLNHFFPASQVYSFGTIGCNLNCQFCQNWHISRTRDLERMDSFATPQEIACRALDLGCLSVAFTYNEPIIFAEYVIDTALACRELGLYRVGVTAGYVRGEARRAFFGVLDAVNIDLKGFSEAFYRQYCGIHLETVLDTILYVHSETDVWMELTTLLIPGLNDSDSEIDVLTDWVAGHLGYDVPLHFTAFNPQYHLLQIPHTPDETLLRARQFAFSKGLRYVYAGNILDQASQTTYCPSCQKPVIVRAWHQVEHQMLQNGTCGNCGAGISGRFIQ